MNIKTIVIAQSNMGKDKERFIQKSGRLLKYMQRHALMLFSIVWVIASAVLLWLVLDKIIDHMDFVLIESVLVASFCFIVIAKLMRKYRRKSASLFIDHFSSLCVSIATILTGAGALICVGIQLYQGLTYHNKVQRIENMYSHINDLYYGMLTINSDLIYADSTKRHLAFETQLKGLNKALKVKAYDQNTYKSTFSRLHKYLDGVQVSAFNNQSTDKSLEQINQYQHYINYLFAKIEKSESSKEYQSQIDSVKNAFNKKVDSFRIYIKSQDKDASQYPEH